MEENKVIEIDIMRMALALWSRLWFILVCAVITGAMAFVFAAYFITPTYESAVELYVNNNSLSVGSTKVSISSSDLSASQSLVDTYIVILETRSTLKEIIEESGVDISQRELLQAMEAQAVDGTEIFKVTITVDDPENAASLANAVAAVLPGRISNVVDGCSVKVVDYAIIPTTKASPDILKYVIVGLFIGALLCCAFIIILELLDNQIHGEDFLLQTYPEVPVLATIPDLMESSGSYGSGYYGYSGYSRYSKYSRYNKYSRYSRYSRYGYGRSKYAASKYANSYSESMEKAKAETEAAKKSEAELTIEPDKMEGVSFDNDTLFKGNEAYGSRTGAGQSPRAQGSVVVDRTAKNAGNKGRRESK